MNLSHKLTFSLVCFVVLLAFTALPAMAQTISAEWTDDLNEDNTADDPGWSVTIGGLSDNAAAGNDDPAITYLDVNLAPAAAAGTQTGFDAVADSATESEGTIVAALGVQIAVAVAITNGDGTTNYQRVTFPVAGPGATVGNPTPVDLALLPMLMDLTTPLYYATFGDTVTVTFNFATPPATNPTIGAPVADLHVSDVTLGTPADWQYIGVSKSGMTRSIMYRSTHDPGATSVTSTVTVGAVFALPATTPDDGVATIHYDDTAPTVTAGSVEIAAPPGFGTPPDGIWNSTFVLTFSISDDGPGSGLPDTNPVRIDTDRTKLDVGPVGLAEEDGTVDGTEYLVRITPRANRVTAAGEAVLITIVPIDEAGNEGSSITSVKLTEVAEVIIPNRAPDFGANTIANITATAGTAITSVTLPAAVDPDAGDSLTYSISPALPAGLTFNAANRMLSGTPSAMMAQTTYTYTATDGDSATDTIMFMITVNAAPTTPDLREMDTATSSRVITIQPQSFVVVVRDMDAMNNEGIQFRSDVTVVEWATMPNLERLFYRGNQGIILGNGGGGALILKESATQSKDRRHGSVGISEIMWGIDSGHLGDEAQEKSSQWIEIHNLNAMVADNAATMDVNEADDGVAKVYLEWKTGRDITSDSTITGNLSNPVLDVVTNFFNNRPGHAAWDVKGNSGNSIAGSDFASMARILPHKKSAYANADGARYDNRDGRHKDHWNASGVTYLIARTTRTDTTDVVYQYKGTPGRVNNVSVQDQPHIIAGRTGVATNDVMINEVGNNSNNLYDWIELKGPAGKNLRNYLISIVRDNTADNILVQFDANDNAKIAPNGHFLILRSDPANDPNHPIAATGYNVDMSAEEQQPGTPNSDVRYKVFDGSTRGALNLPNDDDAKFVLIVRRPDNHEGHRSGQDGGKGVAERGNADLDKVVDVAGYDNNVGKQQYPNPVSNTGLWPLHSFGAPFTDRNAFKVDTVHRRQYVSTNDGRSGVGAHENKNQDDRAAFRDVGWTGVGYRRGVTPSNMHGGTPGYPNNALHGAGGTITGAVYISEIMYAASANSALPQWIELRNANKSVGANLHNWRLTIKNHVDAVAHNDGLWDGKIEASVLLRDLKIKPNGSVLITSRKGPRSEVHLASEDIFSLYPTHRKEFAMTNANSDVINPFGFRITLHANGHEGDRNKWQLVDDIGNLATPDPNDRRGNNERFDMPRWMWPNAVDESGARSSVARTNNKARGLGDGKMAGSWILSSMDMRTNLIDYVYYGATSDISTPGQTVRSPLPVELSSFRPTLENGKVTVQWTTESELDNAGFNILRSDTRDGEFTRVNEQMIQGKGTTAERTTYKWVDTTAKPGAVYYYQIEDVSFAGQHNTLATTKLKGLISAAGKRTLRWGELKNLR